MREPTRSRHNESSPRSVVLRSPVSAGADSSGEIARLVHEMSNLVEAAIYSLGRAAARTRQSGGTDPGLSGDITSALAAVGEMRELVRDHADPRRRVMLAMGRRMPSHGRSLGEEIERAVGMMRPLAAERGIDVRVRLTREAAGVQAAGLCGVVTNAMKNSIEAIGARGQIEIEGEMFTRADGRSFARLRILDDGPGPAPEVIEPSFIPGRTTKVGGSGIGLALAAEVAIELSGTLSLARRWDDGRGGAVLMIEFPARTPGQEREGC